MVAIQKTSTGARALLETLAAEGTKYVFGVAGTSEIPVVAELPSVPQIEYLICLHEAVAIGMADGYARAAGDDIAVALVHATQGTLNGVGYERAALRDGVPLIVVSGAPGQSYTLNEPNHFLRGLPAVLDQLTKWTWQVSRADEIAPAVRRAVTLARGHPQGPVHLLVPQNTMMETVDVEVREPAWPRIRDAASPSEDAIEALVGAIAQARRPLIYAGNGVAGSRAVRPLVELAEALGAPVVAEAVDRGPMVQAVNFPADHSHFLGCFTRDDAEIMGALEQADVVLMLGVKTTYERVVGDWIRNTRIIQVEADAWEVAKNHPCELGVVADLRLTIEAVVERLRSSGRDGVRPAWAAPAPVSSPPLPESSDGVTPEALMRSLDALLPKNTVIVDDSQSLSRYMKRFYRFTQPDTLVGSLASHLGWGLPAALGVQLARPEDRVVSLVSDGSLLFCPQALWTAARYRIPVTIVVSDNAGFKSLRQELRAYDASGAADRATSVDDPRPDISGLARSFGVRTQVVESVDDLPYAFGDDRPAGPVLIDVRMSRADADWGAGWLVPPHSTV